MAADPVGLLNNGVHAQLGDLVDERVLVAFPVLHHCGQQRESSVHRPNRTDENQQAVGWGFFFLLTEVFPAFVLVDVDVDLLDGLQGLRQLEPVVVALWRGSQQLHQQQRVAHHPLNGLNEERAQVDVVCFTPEIK